MASPGLYDFTVKKGDTWAQVLTFRDGYQTPLNVTGCTARMDIKAAQTDSTSILSLTTAGTSANMTLGGALGTLTISVAASVTSAITNDTGLYDLQIASSTGATTTFLEGKVTFIDQYTS